MFSAVSPLVIASYGRRARSPSEVRGNLRSERHRRSIAFTAYRERTLLRTCRHSTRGAAPCAAKASPNEKRTAILLKAIVEIGKRRDLSEHRQCSLPSELRN